MNSQVSQAAPISQAANPPQKGRGSFGGPLLPFIISVALLACGFVLTPSSFNGIRDGLGSPKWPSTDGVVLTASQTESEDSNGRTLYTPHVTYRYIVGGKQYESSQFRAGSSAASTSEFGYAPGQPITVFFAPDDPSHAVLVPALPDSSTFIAFGLGVLFAALGALLLISLVVTIIKRGLGRSPHTAAAN